MVSISEITPYANVIYSHSVYKIKLEDDNKLLLKARIAPHGNEDSMKGQIRTDCSSCSPTSIRIMLTIFTIIYSEIARSESNAAFIKTSQAECHVHVRLLRESHDKTFYWLVLVSAYELVNSNAKWNQQSDELMFKIGVQNLSVIPQLFHQMKNGRLVLIVIIIVDDLLITGPKDFMEQITNNFNESLNLETSYVVQGF